MGKRIDLPLGVSLVSDMKKFRRIRPTSRADSRWLSDVAAGARTALGAAPSAEAGIHYSGIIYAKFNFPGGRSERGTESLAEASFVGELVTVFDR
jgi:hypothetical protein